MDFVLVLGHDYIPIFSIRANFAGLRHFVFLRLNFGVYSHSVAILKEIECGSRILILPQLLQIFPKQMHRVERFIDCQNFRETHPTITSHVLPFLKQKILDSLQNFLMLPGRFFVLLVPYFVDHFTHVSDDMKLVKNDLCFRTTFLRSLHIGFPHIHRDGFNPITPFGADPLVETS